MGAALVLLSAVVAAPPAAPEAPVEIRVVKYPELVEAVKALRGRVVVVDVWADFCLPCKQEFPHLVRLHERHARDGLACVSVSVDEPTQKEAALRFLRAQRATFANFLLAEDPGVWQEKWNLKGVPAVFVFDRQGRLARKFDDDDPDHQFNYTDVEALVGQLLKR